MQDIKFNKILLFINALVPLALLGWDGFRGNLGANPIEFFLRTTGVLTLIFLLITLAISPLRKIFGWNSLIKLRRMIGLYAFFYGCLHLATYLGFDRALDLSGTLADIFQRPFIAVGMLSFFLMIPLAVTSTNGMIKRLGGKNWQRLHRLIYLTAVGGVIHYWMIVKSDITYPFLFGLVLAGLLGYRYFAGKQKLKAQRQVSHE
jgi:sulfoxide reductase heme-binding subunit YedZ